MKKTYLASAIAVALGSISFNSTAAEICIGQNIVIDTIIENVNLPQVELIDPPIQIVEGESLLLSALATLDSHVDAKSSFYWCADKGLLNALANPNTLNNAIANTNTTDFDAIDDMAHLDSIDFSQITFTAPAVAEEGDSIRLGVKLSDNLGYSAYQILELQINDSGNTDDNDPAPVALIDTPASMNAGTNNRISFFISDKDKEGEDNSSQLSTDLYYRRDDGDFQRFARHITGNSNHYMWIPDVAGQYQLKIISSDGNRQTEAQSNIFTVNSNNNDSIRELLEDILITPVDENGELIIGGQIEIIINAQIIIIFDEDNDGSYKIPATREGDYEINIRKNDRSYPSRTIRLEVQVDTEGNRVQTEVKVEIQNAPIIDKVTVSPRDSNGQIIFGATIEIIINGQLILITDNNGNGRYLLPKIAEGQHQVRITKGDFVFQTTEITIDKNTNADVPLEPQAPAPFDFDNNDSIITRNLVILGAYACDQNSVHLVDPSEGELFHSFNADLAGKGIYINPVDFDKDGLTDIAIGGIGQGRDMLIYNTNRKEIGKIISNGDNQGVLIAFGDVDADNDFEIMVTNQSADDTVNLFESDGKAIRALKVLTGKNKINIATGDVDGDGTDELIVVLADNTDSGADNVLIFDEKANLINSFRAVPNPDVNSKGLVVTIGDVNGDGKAEIIVAEAQTQKAYGVAVYNNEGELQSRFNAFSGTDDGTIENTASNCNNPYQGNGLLISTGDVNNDNKADIIVARSGYRQVKLFDGDGEFIDWFNALPEGYQITALGFGNNIGVKLPSIKLEDIADDTAPLENITVIGQPDEPRPEIEDREIRGTVRVANVLIIKISINIGARLIPGPGTRFKKRSSIPKGQKLKSMCKKIKKTAKRKARKIPKLIEVLALNEPVIDKAPTVLQDIQVLVSDVNARRAFGLGHDSDVSLTQNPESGLIQAIQGSTLIELMPVDLTQADLNAPAGIQVEPNGTAYITTSQGQVITMQATIHDLDTFIEGFEAYGIVIERLETDTDGQLRLFYNNDKNYRVGRPHFFSETLVDRNLAVGLYEAKVLFPELENGVIYVFDDSEGTRRWQLILPTPADREALLTLVDMDNNIDAIQLHFDVAVDTIPGSISFTIGGQTYQAIFDYAVRSGALPSSGGVEFNPIDANRYEVIYPNGDRQYLNLIN